MLKADSIQLEYNGRKILQDIYLDCKVGEITGLLGRNGSGKSSLLRIIFGTINLGHKHVSIDGHPISKGYLHHNIAYLPQHNYLPKAVPINKIAPMLVDMNAWTEFNGYDIYQQHQHKTAYQLSGGELRKLETLMILYSKADYILLDEPFTHVSPIRADEIKQIMRLRLATKGFIVTDHQYKNILEVSTKLVLLHNGITKLIKEREELITYGYLSSI